jgi:hypothetical protein
LCRAYRVLGSIRENTKADDTHNKGGSICENHRFSKEKRTLRKRVIRGQFSCSRKFLRNPR